MEEGKIFKISEMEWSPIIQDDGSVSHYDKHLVTDPLDGMVVNISKYPKGFKLPWHTHSCAHGIYVIKGCMETNLGPVHEGEFVWFPAGVAMQHGATATEDCEFLFITNKPFDIHYIDRK